MGMCVHTNSVPCSVYFLLERNGTRVDLSY